MALHAARGEDAAAYLGYLERGRDGQALVADLTPAYGLLSEARLGRMAALSEGSRFLLVLRDPVARLWSHVRMMAARHAPRERDIAARASRIFWRFGRGRFPAIWARSDYRGMLQRAGRALEPERLLVMFFEEMFSRQGIARLCAFLGIAPRPAPLAEPVHAGPPAEMDAEQRRHAARWLAPQYDHVLQVLGRVPPAWQANMQEIAR